MRRARQQGPTEREAIASHPKWALSKGGGSSLPQASRAFFESRFGHDFTAVRIHSDDRSAGLARSINARAFTLGRDIVFGAGEYSPTTAEGTRLLAHELTHVMQQQSQTIIQRQPAGRGTGPPAQDQAIVESNDQIKIIGEVELPYEIWRKPESMKLTKSDEDKLLFNRKLAAIVKLGEMKNERAVPTLVAVIEDKIFGVQRLDPQQKAILQGAAAASLGQIGGTAALSKLRDLLKSQNPDERKIAAQALPGKSGGQVATDLLTALQAEKDASLKAQIIYALGRAAVYSAAKEAQAVADELVKQMENSKDTTIQLAAIHSLGELRLKTTTQALLDQLHKSHSDEAMAAEIVTALGKIGDDKAVELVKVMLKVHVKPRVRIEAALALGKIGGAKARAALKEQLAKETDASVKEAILKAQTPIIHQTFNSDRSP